MAELISRSKEFLGLTKKPRKQARYEYSSDPVTGLRNNKGTYTGQVPKRKKELSIDSETLEHEGITDEQADPSSIADCGSSVNGEMKEILLDAQELLVKWEKANPPKKQNWSDRQSSLNDSWSECRPTIFKSLLQSSFAVLEDVICQKCMCEVAVLRCQECSTTKHLCHSCDTSVHGFLPFHDREAIVNGHFVPIPSTTSRNSKGEWMTVGRSLPLTDICCPNCNSKCKPLEILQESLCIVVTLKGRFDINHQLYECQKCCNRLNTSDPVVVTQSGFWPGSIKNVVYVFHQDLLLHWSILQKEMPGISERSFLKSLELFSKHKGRVPVINSATFGTSFKEWKFCQYELDRLRKINWMACPACEDCQHSVHVDGNMKLYRFKSAGKRKRESYYGETFVVSNEKVDGHIQKVYQSSKQKKPDEDSMCGQSNWRAAGNTIKKKRNLVETGLEISGCRHALAQHSINMMYGEVYGYAHYLQVNYYITKKVQFFWYDVVCKYWPWLKKNDPGTAQKMKPALSVMHAKAHAWSCQALWGGRWQDGAAATTGEEVEHINSHFSRLGSCTKHMLPEGREELLTEHAIFWNRKKIEGLPRSLAKRYTKTCNQVKTLQEELKVLLESHGINEGDISLERWKADILQVAREEELSYNKKGKLSLEEEVFLCHLRTLDTCCAKQELLQEIADSMYGKRTRQLDPKPSTSYARGEIVLCEKAVLYLQTQMEHLHYSVTQMAFNMAKIADGSKQRQKLRSKISSEKEKLKDLVDKYNRLVAERDQVKLDDVENGNFSWKAEVSGGDAVPFRTKRAVVDKHMEIARFDEEVKLLQKEMMSFVNFYKSKVLPSLVEEQKRLENLWKEVGSSDEGTQVEDCTQNPGYTTKSDRREVVKAKLALVLDGRDFAMKQMAAGVRSFAPVLTDDLDAFRQVLLARQLGDEEEDEEEEYLNVEEEEDDDVGEAVDDSPVTSPSGDIVLVTLSNIGSAPIFTVSPEELKPAVTCWKLPIDASQGRYRGRNGSNACSLISLLIGHTLQKRNIGPLSCDSQLPSTIVDVVCGCIEMGNRAYDLYRESLPSRYLSIQEAATVLEMWFEADVGDNLPVRLDDQHTQSTIAGQLQEAIQSETNVFGYLILNEKTSLFHINSQVISYVDTHAHAPHGPVIIQAPLYELVGFCKAVWELEGNDGQTYGNLVFVKFCK